MFMAAIFHGGILLAMKEDDVTTLNPAHKAVICGSFLKPVETAVNGHDRPISYR